MEDFVLISSESDPIPPNTPPNTPILDTASSIYTNDFSCFEFLSLLFYNLKNRLFCLL